MKSKKIFLVLLIFMGFLILTGCIKKTNFSSPCYKIASGEEITFFIVSDPHYISKNTYDEDKAFSDFCCSGDGKLINYSDEIIDTLIWEIENKKPNFLIVSGDLTCNGEKESHLDFAKKLESIEKQGTCVFVIPGNHDIENPWASNYIGKDPCKTESVSHEEFSQIYGSFGYNEAISRDENSLSYLVTPSEDVWLLMLDSTKKNESKTSKAPEMSGIISSKTLKWVEQCAYLAKENNVRLIASMHHSLLEHNPVIKQNYVIDNNQEVIRVFKSSNIEIVLTGHIHLQDIKSFEKESYRLYDIATGSILAYPNIYGVLKYSLDSGYEYNTNKIDVEGWASKNMIKDNNLIDFKIYSKSFFESRSYEKYYDALIKSSSTIEENYEAMAKSIAKLNVEYFNGLRNNALKHTINISEYEMLMDFLPSCLKGYIISMSNDELTDNNKILIK